MNQARRSREPDQTRLQQPRPPEEAPGLAPHAGRDALPGVNREIVGQFSLHPLEGAVDTRHQRDHTAHTASPPCLDAICCQQAGTVSERKYENEGGPGLAICAELIRRYSTQPAVDLRHFVSRIFFNLFAGNNDSHAKNLSICHQPGKGVTLAPFYDLICTRLYPGLSQDFALPHSARILAERLRRFVFSTTTKLAARLAA